MLNPGFDKQNVVRAEGDPIPALCKPTRSTGDDIEFILIMRCLIIEALGRVKANAHRAMVDRIVELLVGRLRRKYRFDCTF